MDQPIEESSKQKHILDIVLKENKSLAINLIYMCYDFEIQRFK